MLYLELASIAVRMCCMQAKRIGVKAFLLELTVIGVTEVLCRTRLLSVIFVQPTRIDARVFLLEITVIGVRVVCMQRTRIGVYFCCSSFKDWCQRLLFRV